MRSLLGSLIQEAEMIHIITGEYPPIPGGVGGYTHQLAHALVEEGEIVHVWTGGSAAGSDAPSDEDGVFVHRTAGRFRPADLRQLQRQMDAIPGPQRVLVQWTPHSYGMRGLNFAFPLWLWMRASTMRVELMVHEAFVAFGEGNWKRDAAAGLQRFMAAALLQAAGKVWITIPKWEERLRPWAFGKNIPFEWLPVPSNIPSTANVSAIVNLRRQFTHFRHPLIGHFGSFRQDVESLVTPAILEMESSQGVFLFVGRGSDEARRAFITLYPEWFDRIFSTGEIGPEAIAAHLSACDVLLQPYPDGISTRRGSAMAALSLGVPIVTNLGPLSEPFWTSSGAIAKAQDSSAAHLAAATLELIDEQPRRIQLSAQGRELYQERFHVRHTVSALLRDSVPLPHSQAAQANAAA
jgi:glycosyltransferase involved in cell wall biosynthesis